MTYNAKVGLYFDLQMKVMGGINLASLSLAFRLSIVPITLRQKYCAYYALRQPYLARQAKYQAK